MSSDWGAEALAVLLAGFLEQEFERRTQRSDGYAHALCAWPLPPIGLESAQGQLPSDEHADSGIFVCAPALTES